MPQRPSLSVLTLRVGAEKKEREGCLASSTILQPLRGKEMGGVMRGDEHGGRYPLLCVAHSVLS
jgi:hypothetical protein